MFVGKHINRNLAILCLFAVLVGLAACGKDDSKEREISIELTSPTVGAAGNSQFMRIVCDGDWSLSFVYEGTQTDWCSTFMPTGSGSRTDVPLTYTRNTSDDARSVVIRLTSGSRTAEAVLTQRGQSDEEEDGSLTEGIVHAGWLELPGVVTNENYLYAEHHASLESGRMVRNYSLLYDKKEKISYWVAYPLSNLYAQKNVSRPARDPWTFDPEIPAEYQVDISESGYGSVGSVSYDRGHQIPSADRLASTLLNYQTFYSTNSTPQASRFNQQIWGQLEAMVRESWMPSCDTLYVVTGAVLRTVGGSERISYVQKGCAIPNYYYKVLLQLNPKSAGGSGYKAIGFWFENRSYSESKPTRSHVVSVDEIERKTGFDFFVNLPDDVEAAVEAECVPQEWGL